jgi:hypothetical protein
MHGHMNVKYVRPLLLFDTVSRLGIFSINLDPTFHATTLPAAKQYIMQAYEVVEVHLHAFFTSRLTDIQRTILQQDC